MAINYIVPNDDALRTSPFDMIDSIVAQKWQNIGARCLIHILPSSARNGHQLAQENQDNITLGDSRIKYTFISLDPGTPSFIIVAHSRYTFVRECLLPISTRVSLSSKPIAIIGGQTSRESIVTYIVNHENMIRTETLRAACIAPYMCSTLDCILNAYGFTRKYDRVDHGEYECVRSAFTPVGQKILPRNLCPRSGDRLAHQAFCTLQSNFWIPRINVLQAQWSSSDLPARISLSRSDDHSLHSPRSDDHSTQTSRATVRSPSAPPQAYRPVSPSSPVLRFLVEECTPSSQMLP